MIVIPYRKSETHYSIVIVLEDENMERIKAYDPAEIKVSRFPDEWQNLLLRSIEVAYVSPSDTKQFMDLMINNKIQDAFEFLHKGWKFKPEQGDNDQEYQTPLHN